LGVIDLSAIQLLQIAREPSTVQSHKRLWSKYFEFCNQNSIKPLPCSPWQGIRFLSWLVIVKQQSYEVKNAVGAFKYYFSLMGSNSPISSEIAKRVVEGASRYYMRIDRNPRSHSRVEISALENLLLSPPKELSHYFVVKRASIIAFALCCMARASEPTLFNRCDIH
jgi:hypothetical protein